MATSTGTDKYTKVIGGKPLKPVVLPTIKKINANLAIQKMKDAQKKRLYPEVPMIGGPKRTMVPKSMIPIMDADAMSLVEARNNKPVAPVMPTSIAPISGIDPLKSKGYPGVGDVPVSGINPFQSRGYPSGLPAQSPKFVSELPTQEAGLPQQPDFTARTIEVLKQTPPENWSQLGLGMGFAPEVITGTNSWQEREVAAVEAWIASDYNDAFIPASLSPMTANVFGMSEEDRLSMGYAPLENYVKGESPFDYAWTREAGDDGGGGSGGGYSEDGEEQPLDYGESGPGKPNWSEEYYVPGAPDWWRGVVPDITSPELEYASLLNSLIPFLSAEDQRSVANSLYILYPDVFASYSGVTGNFQSPTTETDLNGRNVNSPTAGIPQWGDAFGEDEYKSKIYSKDRANEMLQALDLVGSKMKKVDGRMGPGYYYLKQLASAVRDFAPVGGGLSSRQQLTQLMSALDPLLAQTGSDSLASYGSVSKMLVTPFMSAGGVMPVTKGEDGTYTFGKPNSSLY